MSVKLIKSKLDYYNTLPKENILSSFGKWTSEINELNGKYSTGEPFEHLIIDDFLEDTLANTVSELYPSDLTEYHCYNNPVEVKYAYDNIEELDDSLKSIYYLLSTKVIEDLFSKITDVKLETDPYLHGAGLHLHPRDGRLGIHLDYEIHPYTGKQRCLNVILYLSKNWKKEWNGHSELWDKNGQREMVISPVKFNTALVFRTNEISWHGVSKKIKCPEGVFRKSLAFYYVSDVNTETSEDGSGFRKKAAFICGPDEPNKDKITPFLAIRPFRRITDEDIQKIWPEWNAKDY